MAKSRKPRLLVLNQYYWPGVEATAQLLTELCEALAQEFDVKVVTGVLHGHETDPRQLVRNGVEITRVPSTSFERSKISRLQRRRMMHTPPTVGALSAKTRGSIGRGQVRRSGTRCAPTAAGLRLSPASKIAS